MAAGSITTGADSGVILWDVQRATAGETFSGQPGRVLTPQITRDGRTLYTAGPGAAVFIWDLAGTRRLGRPFSTGAPSAQPGLAAVTPGQAFLALSSDGGLIARGQDDGAVTIVDGHTLARRRSFPVVTTGPVHGLGFVPRSRLLVVTGPEGFLALADADRGRVLERAPGHQGNVLPPSISADGRLLVTGSDDQTVRLWSLPDMRPVAAPLRFGGNGIEDVQISPDGRRLTIVLVDPSGESATLEVWDAGSRRRVARLDVPDTPTAVRFSPDGRLLAVGYPNGRSHLWSTTNWKPATRLLAGDVGDQVAHRRRTQGAQLVDRGRVAEAGTRDERVALVVGRGVPVGQRRGDAALGPPRRALVHRGLRDDEHAVAEPADVQGQGEPCHAGADHHDVGRGEPPRVGSSDRGRDDQALGRRAGTAHLRNVTGVLSISRVWPTRVASSRRAAPSSGAGPREGSRSST